jgi:hypothetical protein
MTMIFATRLSSFGSTSSGSRAVVGPTFKEGPMEHASIEPAIKLIIAEVHNKLSEATRIAKAAEACTQSNAIAEGIEVLMDIEQLIYEVGRLHDATSLLGRMRRNQD